MSRAAQEETRPFSRASLRHPSWERCKHSDLLYDTPHTRSGLTCSTPFSSLLAKLYERGSQLLGHPTMAVLLGLPDVYIVRLTLLVLAPQSPQDIAEPSPGVALVLEAGDVHRSAS